MSKNKEEPMKQCPNCQVGNKIKQRKCWSCGLKFPSMKKIRELRVSKYKQANLLGDDDER